MNDPRELPSGRSAIDFADGRPGSFGAIVAHTALRTGLVAVGLYAMGDRNEKLLLRSLGGALAIEAFVLAWVFTQPKPTDAPGAPPQ